MDSGRTGGFFSIPFPMKSATTKKLGKNLFQNTFLCKINTHAFHPIDNKLIKLYNIYNMEKREKQDFLVASWTLSTQATSQEDFRGVCDVY